MTVFVKRFEFSHIQILGGLGGQRIFKGQSPLRERTPREFGETRLLEYPLDATRVYDDHLWLQALRDVLSRKPLFAQFGDPVTHIGGEAPVLGSRQAFGKQAQFAHAQIMGQRVQRVFREPVAFGRLSGRQAFHHIGAQGFILSLGGSLGVEKKHFEVVMHGVILSIIMSFTIALIYSKESLKSSQIYLMTIKYPGNKPYATQWNIGISRGCRIIIVT
jgi:hypothetical protein